MGDSAPPFLYKGGILMIRLNTITEDNFNECVKMEVADDQKNFVASNMRSLAQAWLYHDNARPFAIYNDEAMVGFLMVDISLSWDDSKSSCYLWRLMIAKDLQGKGYGNAAVQCAIDYVKEHANPDKMRTSVVPGNDAAEKLYRSLGFIPTGEFDEDEMVMELNLRE